MRTRKLIAHLLLLLALLGSSIIPSALSQCESNQPKILQQSTPNTSELGYKIVKILKRPSPVYTQGIFFDSSGKHLYESGGLYGESTLRKLKYPSLSEEYGVKLERKYFAEGIAQCGNTVYQLTWMEKLILRFDADDLEKLGQITLDTKIREGWGLAEYNQETLLATDGSSKIYFLDCAEKLRVRKNINVTLNGNPVNNLNALVYAKGFIFANVYFENSIYKIDPNSGKVLKRYNMISLVDYEISHKTLTKSALGSGDVLNGIAYDNKRDVFLVTGKRWGFFYEVQFD